MNPDVDQVMACLEEMAPTRLAEEWDNPGVQVKAHSGPVRRILLALDPTLEAVRQAAREKAEILLTHHPLIFRPLSSIVDNTFPGDAVQEAVKSSVTVISAHTNLDSARGGINDILAALFGLTGVEVLEPSRDGMEGCGLGRVGDLPRALPLSALVKEAKRIFGAETLRVCGPEDLLVERLAVVGGSGGSLGARALRQGAQALLTGDVGHHDALACSGMGLAVIDAGHFHTEFTALQGFKEALTSRFKSLGWEVRVEIHEGEASPMRWM
jgi:dinuclear metal center YbgI/SA1388 family protein